MKWSRRTFFGVRGWSVGAAFFCLHRTCDAPRNVQQSTAIRKGVLCASERTHSRASLSSSNAREEKSGLIRRMGSKQPRKHGWFTRLPSFIEIWQRSVSQSSAQKQTSSSCSYFFQRRPIQSGAGDSLKRAPILSTVDLNSWSQTLYRKDLTNRTCPAVSGTRGRPPRSRSRSRSHKKVTDRAGSVGPTTF